MNSTPGVRSPIPPKVTPESASAPMSAVVSMARVRNSIAASGRTEGQARSGRQTGRFQLFLRDLRRNPTHDLPWRSLQTRIRAVLALHAVLHHFELQRTDRGEQGNALRGIWNVDRLNDAFLEQLFESFTEPFKLSGVRALQPRETFWREARNFAVNEFFVGG